MGLYLSLTLLCSNLCFIISAWSTPGVTWLSQNKCFEPLPLKGPFPSPVQSCFHPFFEAWIWESSALIFSHSKTVIEKPFRHWARTGTLGRVCKSGWEGLPHMKSLISQEIDTQTKFLAELKQMAHLSCLFVWFSRSCYFLKKISSYQILSLFLHFAVSCLSTRDKASFQSWMNNMIFKKLASRRPFSFSVLLIKTIFVHVFFIPYKK